MLTCCQDCSANFVLALLPVFLLQGAIAHPVAVIQLLVISDTPFLIMLGERVLRLPMPAVGLPLVVFLMVFGIFCFLSMSGVFTFGVLLLSALASRRPDAE